MSDLVAICFAIFLVVSFCLFLWIDLRNLFGLRTYLLETRDDIFLLFWYGNGGIVDLFHWTCLGISAGVSLYVALNCEEKDTFYYFWLFLGIGFLLMGIEDCGNIRDYVKEWADPPTAIEEQGITGTVVEALYFSLLAFFPVISFLFYRGALERHERWYYVYSGFVFYAIAVSLSFTGRAFSGLLELNFYEWMGGYLHEWALTIGDEQVREIWERTFDEVELQFYLMDTLVEESLELAGASSFLAATTYLFLSRRSGE